jgi:NDP-sugar pyrophosphorylase family protein
MREGEELVVQPFQRLIGEDQLMGYPYDGFYASMDTFKDKQHLDDLYARGSAPWEVWKSQERTVARPSASATAKPKATAVARAVKRRHA